MSSNQVGALRPTVAVRPAVFCRLFPSVYQSDAKDHLVIPRGCLQRFRGNGNRDDPSDGVTMTDVKAKSPSFSRRKLSTVIRKAVTSYYTAEEQQEIAQAAKREGISMSSFVATASLAQARRGNRKL